MKDKIKHLEARLAEFDGQKNDPNPIVVEDKSWYVKDLRSSKLPPSTNDSTNFTKVKDRHLEAGSSDIVISKLAEMQHINVSANDNFSNLYNNKLPQKHISNKEGIKSMSLSYAEEMVSYAHFYLASVNLPFEEGYIRAKLRQFYSNGHWEFLSDEYWKPLIYVLLALGQHYIGIRSDLAEGELCKEDKLVPETYPLFWAGLSEIFPLRNVYNDKIVIILILAAYYFRSINEDQNAVMYSTLAMQVSIQLNLHLQPEDNAYSEEDVEIRKRIFWSAFTTNRFLCAKLGHPTLLDASDITVSYPKMVSFDDGICKKITFPDAEDMKSFLELAKIAEDIVNVVYKKRSLSGKLAGDDGGLLASVDIIIRRLIDWNENLPSNFRLKLDERKHGDGRMKRLKCSLHLNYCYQIHLATVAVLYQLVHEKAHAEDSSFSLANISLNILTMLTICINAAQLTTNIMITCFKETTIAVFGVVDVDYVFSASLTFSLSKFLGMSDEGNIQNSLNSCLDILQELSRKGNSNATAKFSKIRLFIQGLTERSNETFEFHFNSNHSENNLFDLSEGSKQKHASDANESIFSLDSFPQRKDEDERLLFPSQILDTSFVPSLNDSVLNRKSKFFDETDVEFWENAYSNIHIWAGNIDHWDAT
ncbi:uncharacterized protein PRCAT00004284001 [Priceomyces carsonii]|uniref:uncharacterized protein n=1 Tax=Priceomyces carsonii TaxID=28549 RepID=UPI002ED9473D|nr:unnamed protein product [Priceomyces carsonii]